MILFAKVALLLLTISVVSGADPLKFCDPYVANIGKLQLQIICNHELNLKPN